jgi:hypothetical protein
MPECLTIAQHVRNNIELVMSYYGWHNRDFLAKFQPPVPDATFCGWKASGTTSFEAIDQIANAIGWPPKVLAGKGSCEERNEMLAHQIWNPITSKGAAEFTAALREHLGKAKQVLSLMQEVPCSWMTERLLDRMYDSYFEPVDSTTYGRKLKQQYKTFGQEQRKRFDNPATPLPNNMLVLIPRCDFEKLVKQQRPFDLCKLADVQDAIGHIRALCQDHRIAFALIDTPSVSEIEAVRSAYGRVDSVVVIDDHFTFRRDIEEINGEMFPRLLRWSTEPVEIAKAKGIVNNFIESGIDFESRALAELDNYEHLLENE